MRFAVVGPLYTETIWKRFTGSFSRWLCKTKQSFQSINMKSLGRIRTGIHAEASALCSLMPPQTKCFKQRPGATCASCACSQQRAASFSNSINRHGPWQGRDDIYQAGLATCCDIYPRLCLTRAAPPRPPIGAAARGAKWDRKLSRPACVWDGPERGSFIIMQCVGKKWMRTLNIYESRWEPHH